MPQPANRSQEVVPAKAEKLITATQGVPAPRYQVFLSSTYADLKDERQAVTQALLRMNKCIPAGMELFTASSQPPWDVITRALEGTDYLVLIIGNRYGSFVPGSNIGYTEREYDYAIDNGIPVLPFLSENVSMLREHIESPKHQKAWKAFREKVEARHTVERWTTKDDLVSRVPTALQAEFTAQPRPGWVRGTDNTESPPDPPAIAAPQQSESALDVVRVAIETPDQLYRLGEAVQSQIDQVMETPALIPSVSAVQAGTAEEHGSRLAEIVNVMKPLMLTIAIAARRGNKKTDEQWMHSIRELSETPLLSGLVALINLYRAPGVLAFHSAGIGACVGRRDDLAGRLLSNSFVVNDWHHDEPIPAATALEAEVLFPAGWPSRSLHDLMVPLLAQPELGSARSIENAWERWAYLSAVTITYMRANGIRAAGAQLPYLLVRSHRGNVRSVAGIGIHDEVSNQGDSHAVFDGGKGIGSSSGFISAAVDFDLRYGNWADQQDWAALPHGGGSMPTGPHYPGVR